MPEGQEMQEKKEMGEARKVQEDQELRERPLEELFARLDGMLERLADREVSLEESFAVYAEGTKLLRYCGEKLDRVEKKMLVLNEEGKLDEF